jgi:hypothetical protein
MGVPVEIHPDSAVRQGQFEVAGLPPNEDYRAVAVDYLEDGEEYDQTS